MAIIQGPTDSFLLELAKRIHDFDNDVLKLALYDSTASLGPETTEYTTTGEVVGTGYVAGGATLTTPTSAVARGVAYWDFADVEWAASTITARGAMLYNSTRSNKAVWILNFGIDRSSSASTFRAVFPPASYDTSIVRFGALR